MSHGSRTPPALVTKAGSALLRAPYAWLAVTVLLFLSLLRSVSLIVEDSEEGSLALAVAVTLLIAVDVVIAEWYYPRFFYVQLQGETAAGAKALLRWSLGTAPYLLTLSAVVAGAQQWALSVGFITSTVLLLRASRTMAKDQLEPEEP